MATKQKSKRIRWPNGNKSGLKRKPYTIEKMRRKLPKGIYIKKVVIP